MDFKRILKRYLRGDDVMYVKNKLVELGFLKKATHNLYGNDTYKAVKEFQAKKGLKVDGIVGINTWNALFKEKPVPPKPDPDPKIDIPDWISATVASALKKDLAKVNEKRLKICLLALNWCIDPSKPTETLKGFYIRGGNSYNTDLNPNIMSLSKLTSYFRKAAYEPYFDGGRKEMMLEQSAKDGYDKIGCDCSGLVVGLLKKLRYVSTGFDATANKLYSSYCIPRTGTLVPGDFAWRNGHIGLYVGGGYVVESMGGAYGIQITNINSRKGYNYVDKKLHKFSAWTEFGNPKAYD